MLNPVREGEEDFIEAIRYRRRLKIFENFLLRLSYRDFEPFHFFAYSLSCDFG